MGKMGKMVINIILKPGTFLGPYLGLLKIAKSKCFLDILLNCILYINIIVRQW